MNLSEFRQHIVDYVIEHGCVKAVDLVVYATSLWYRANSIAQLNDVLSEPPTIDAIAALVAEGRLIEVCYVVNSQHWREKSLYFPANTLIILPEKQHAGTYCDRNAH